MTTLRDVKLEDKYTQEGGRIYLTGIQALVRLPMMQRRRDLAAGHNTAGYISGYRGSPLGGYDQQLMSAQKFLEIPANAKYDILYIDPPYDFSDVELYKCLVQLRAGDFVKNDGVIVVERASKSAPIKWPCGFEPIRERIYGHAIIYYGKLVKTPNHC